MRILVTGSREWTDEELLHATLDEVTAGHEKVTIVHGGCYRGADVMTSAYATQRGWTDETHEAEWNAGRPAGPIRNKEMVALGADVCVAFFKMTAANKGTTGCCNFAKKAGIPVVRVEG